MLARALTVVKGNTLKNDERHDPEAVAGNVAQNRVLGYTFCYIVPRASKTPQVRNRP